MEKWRKSIKGERTGIKTSKREVVEGEVKKNRAREKTVKKRKSERVNGKKTVG